MTTSKNFNQVEIAPPAKDETRKPAFAYFNRAVNLKHVELIFEKMKVKGYRHSAPVHVIKAEDAKRYGITKLFDINKNEIPESELDSYYLVIDGQHRTYSVVEYNSWLTSQGQKPIEIPAIEAEFKNDESLIEYLNELSVTTKEWTKEDYLKGAANLCVDEQLLQRYKELIKTESNPSGISLSTLNLIYCNGSGLTRTDFILLCSGNKTKGKANKPIIPGYDLQTGNQFIEICKEVGFSEIEIAKRYLITEFNRIRNSEVGKESALEIFKSITLDDVNVMRNGTKRIDETQVISQFETIKMRFYQSLSEEQEDIDN